MAVQVLSEEEVRALGVTTDVPTAGRAWGLERSQAYKLAREGHFPCPVLPVGSRKRVAKAALMRALGYEATPAASAFPEAG